MPAISPLPPLWIAIHLRQLALEVFHPRWLAKLGTDCSIVVCDNKVVCALSEPARHAGIVLGMRQSSVGLLSLEAIIKERDLGLEQELRQKVAITLLQYSPQVAYSDEHRNVILIEVAASLRLFGGIRCLFRRIQDNLETLGLSAQFGIARNASAATIFSQQYSRNFHQRSRSLQLCLSQKHLARRLDVIPCHLLAAAAAQADWLSGIACNQLGALRQLPRAGLQRRCGKALLKALDTAYGEHPEFHQCLEVPVQFDARCELPDRIENTDIIFRYARGLILQLCGWLQAQQSAVKKIHLYLGHERGRQAVAPTLLPLQLAQASWQEPHLTHLLKERLGQLSLNAAAISLHLQAAEIELRQAHSECLFPDSRHQTEDQTRLIELLIARLGAEQVLQAAPHADHRPEVANRWVSVMEKIKPTVEMSMALKNFSNPRPSWLLEQAQVLRVQQHSPYYGSKLKLLSSAERIEAGWWNGQLVTRDYFIAECNKYFRYWIYRERIGNAQLMHEDEVWFLHGFFG
jgi:protein ImuB